MAAPVLQFKRGLLANLPALRAGEPGFTTDTYDLYVGLTSDTATNKFFGSHRYWKRETTSTGSGLNLVEGTSNGSGFITLKAPDSLAGVGTYVLPDTNSIVDGYFLKVASDGTLSWDTVGGTNGNFSNPTLTGITTVNGTLFDVNTNSDFSGITTFSNTTDNTLGDVNTGAVQIDGGVGVEKNLSVGAGLSVAGASYFNGAVTFYGGQINLGDSDTDDIVVAGEFKSSLIPSDTGSYNLGTSGKRWADIYTNGVATLGSIVCNDGALFTGSVQINTNLNVNGNVTVGGTTITLLGEDVFIQNKDIVLGYTTSITPNDTTANHAGVAIASTEGTPLVPFASSGINTLPDTYKQMMWFKSGTLGFSTDAFAFNYGVAIGTTTMANGVRLAVGTGVTISDTSVTASTFYGSLVGNVSSADQVKTVTASDSDANYYVTFVDANNGSATNETVYTDNGIYYNPATNTFTTQHASFTGNLNVAGITTLAGNVNLGDNSSDTITVSGVATFNQSVYVGGTLTVGSVTIGSTSGGSSVGEDISTRNINASGIATVSGLIDGNGGADISGHTELDTVNVSIALTTTNLTVGSGVGITQFSSAVGSGTSTSSVPTSSAVIDYVDTQIGNIDLTLGLSADSGSSTVNTSQTLTIAGTANEIETSTSAQTITVGLPNAVVVGTSLSSPTIKTATIQHSNGTEAVTIDATGNVGVSSNLTVSGNLYVNGSTTQVNTSTLTVEDRTIQLGIVDGAAPSTATTWDLGVLFNYYTDSAKQSAVVWEHGDGRFKFGSVISDGGGTGVNNPQITVSTFAPIEIGSLWVNDCAGQSQVISCTGTERFLENITVDAGTF
jgi:hypothetical protein